MKKSMKKIWRLIDKHDVAVTILSVAAMWSIVIITIIGE
jgi:hypothetical protein